MSELGKCVRVWPLNDVKVSDNKECWTKEFYRIFILLDY